MDVVSIVEGRVPGNRSGEFEAAYAKMKDAPSDVFPNGWKTSYLVNDRNDREVYRIMTFWESFELLDRYVRTVETPTAQALFKRMGVEPVLRVFDVTEHITKPA